MIKAPPPPYRTYTVDSLVDKVPGRILGCGVRIPILPDWILLLRLLPVVEPVVEYICI